MSSFVLSSGALARADAPGFLRGGALRSRTGAPAARGRAGPVQTNAFFGGFGGAPNSNGAAMVCIDCGEDARRLFLFSTRRARRRHARRRGRRLSATVTHRLLFPRAALRSLEHAGYVYRGGDFDSLAKDWECPPCGSGKNRFKVYQEGNAYDQMAAQKKANKAALAAKKKGGPSKRELLKQKMLEEQAEMDKKKGGGFFGR